MSCSLASLILILIFPLLFKNDGRPYVRVSKLDCLSNPDHLRDLLVEKWDLEPPRILLAVTGGAMDFDLPPRLDELIINGLAKAAASQSMWITTGGTNSGVMKYVGSAIAKSGFNMPVIGICSWSVINNKAALEVLPDGNPVAGGLTYYGDPDKPPPKPKNFGPGCSLDKNHTHFILVDDGTNLKFGGEIDSRAKLEKSIGEFLSNGKFGSESPISTVLLAIQGGPGTVDTIQASLKNGTPVVVVDGSGKSSNAMAYAYKLPLPGERADSKPETIEGLKELIMNEFEMDESNPTFKKVFDTCINCVSNMEYRRLLHIYVVDYSDTGTAVSLDIELLDAVLAHDAEQWVDWDKRMGVDQNDKHAMIVARMRQRDLSRALKLEMALMWDRINVVLEEVSRYSVLPNLAKVSKQLLYTVKKAREAPFKTHLNEEYRPKANEVVELLDIKDMIWKVKAKGGEIINMEGSNLKKKGTNFADTVILAQLNMLEFLMLHEKLAFVVLFLQGMRQNDIHAFLSLKIEPLWLKASVFGLKAAPPAPERPKTSVAKSEKGLGITSKTLQIPGMVEVARLMNKSVPGSYGSNEIQSMSRQGTTLERDTESQDLLNKVQTFVADDIFLPHYMHLRMVEMVADAQLRCWLEKKQLQQEMGWEMSESTTEMLATYGGSKRGGKVEFVKTLRRPLYNARMEWAVWLIRMLIGPVKDKGLGYVVSRFDGRNQLVEEIDQYDTMIECLAETLHHKWVQKKVEAHWQQSSRYSSRPGNQSSPYMMVFSQLQPKDRAFLIGYSTKIIKSILEQGVWIWRPDNLENLYLCSLSSCPHLAEMVGEGHLWRSALSNHVASLISENHEFIQDFTSFNALDPYFHLLIWSVMTKHFELAKFFWDARPQYSVVYSLVAALVSKRLLDRTSMAIEVQREYVTAQNVFTQYGLGVLKQCIARDRTAARHMLKAQYDCAGWIELWRLAYMLKEREITVLPLYVEVIREQWMGLVSKKNPLSLMIFNILFPFAIFMGGEGDNGDEKDVDDLSLIQTTRGAFEQLSIDIDTTLLQTVGAPTIHFNGPKRQLSFSVPNDDIVVLYTLGEDSKPGGDPSVIGLEFRSDSSPITLPKNIIYQVRAVSRLKGFKDSQLALKNLDMSQNDKTLNCLPSFIFSESEGSGLADGTAAGWFKLQEYRLMGFYTSPYVTFFFLLMTQLTYVMLFSFCAIARTKPLNQMDFSKLEDRMIFVVYAWTITLMTDEYRQLVNSGISMWWESMWNKIDFIFYMNVIFCVALRTVDDYDYLLLSRTMNAMGALLLWLRMGRLYAFSELLGPKLVMIGGMMQDIFVFMMLLMVILIGYGVAMHAIVEPFRGFDQFSVNTVFFKPIFNAIGETFLEEIQGHTDCVGEDFTQCNDISNYLIVFMVVVYMIISNILLVNLLIAMMSKTYGEIEEKALDIWSLQNVDLLEEFRDLLPLPPPINLMFNVYTTLGWLARKVLPRRIVKVVPKKDETTEVIDVSSSRRMTEQHENFLRVSAISFKQIEKDANKEEMLRSDLSNLIISKTTVIDNQMKDIDFTLSNLKTMLVDLGRLHAHTNLSDTIKPMVSEA